jgi:O-glycosyl hydrolase
VSVNIGRLFRITTALGLAVTTITAAAAGSQPGPDTSAPGAALGTVEQAASATGDPLTATGTVRVRPDPSYEGAAFEGWGTSLAWFANATGGYPDEIRNKLAELVFGADGLNLNIARYNIGGGNAPDVPGYLRPGGAVQGWWQAPSGTTRNDEDWWDPTDQAHWNLGADATQRWWVDRIKNRVTRWETFSNSPPYFQTVSGYVSGGLDSGTKDQIRPDTVDAFATYLVRVTQELEKAHGIKVASLDPLNEPNTNYWSTRLGTDGDPTGGRQEGAHAGPALQQAVINAVAAKLAASGSATHVSAMDETNPGTFVGDWTSYDDTARASVGQLNVHTYGTSQRTSVRDIAKGEDKPLWMSEVEGSWGTKQDFTDMAPGLGMAQQMVDDLRELEPTAWLFWQPVEDYDNMKPGGETPAGMNWGSVQLRFNCTAADTLATCPIYTNTKFDTVRNFTHYIRPGDHLLKTGDTSSLAALSPQNRLSVVYVNDSTSARTVSLDLSAFARVKSGTTVTPITTSSSGALVSGTSVAVRNRSAEIQVPARSVTTLQVNGPVTGVDATAPLAQAGHVYRLQGVTSGKSLSPSAKGTSLVIRTDDPASTQQLWTLRPLTTGTNAAAGATGERARYAVGTVTGDRLLGVVNGALTLVPVTDRAASPDQGAQWILSTTGDGTYTLVNVATRQLVDVGGGATADGSSVGTWLPNSNTNQLWRIVDETVLGIDGVHTFTPIGKAPALPSTVVPLYRDGARGTLPVTWTVPADKAWVKKGQVKVAGVATDVLGRTHPARAEVQVDVLTATLPSRAKTYVGGEPTLPATVTAITRGRYRTERPVVWNPVTPEQYARAGVVTVAGSADAGDGRTLPATLRLQATEPVLANAALAPGVTAEATFTEPGYSPAQLVNGVLTDKAWSNWQSGKVDASDTLTVTLPSAQDVAKVVTHFYSDWGRDSYAQTLRVEARSDTGAWTDAGGPVSVPGGQPAPAVEVTVPGSAGKARAVRVVLDARPGLYMTVSEIEVFTKSAPGRSSDATASSVTLDSRTLVGFSPAVTDYAVKARGKLPVVAAVATDPYATVAVTQAAPRTRSATVTITSEDGSATKTYTIRFS